MEKMSPKGRSRTNLLEWQEVLTAALQPATLKLGSYTEIVARGWESKSVEDQIEAAQDRKKIAPRLSLEEIAKQTRIEGVLLQRTRLLRDLDKSRKDLHRAVLSAGLEYLERQLAEMGWVPPGQSE